MGRERKITFHLCRFSRYSHILNNPPMYNWVAIGAEYNQMLNAAIRQLNENEVESKIDLLFD